MTDDAPPTAAALGLAACHLCGKVSPVAEKYCPRCDAHLHLRKPHSLARTWAFLTAAAAFYLPANLLPIMTVSGIAASEGDTILSGVVAFWKTGAYPIAIVIFTASVLIPLLKFVALVWLCLAARGHVNGSPAAMSRIYHITELVGRWSMVDVFVVAILVCLVQLGALMTITVGPAALSFALVVIFTMFAAMSFDPRLLWDRQRGQEIQEKDEPEAHEQPAGDPDPATP